MAMTTQIPSIDVLQEHLSGLLSADLTVRQTMEEKFNSLWVETYPSLLLPNLVQLLKPEISIQHRSMAAVLFRRMAFKSVSSSKVSSTDNTNDKRENKKFAGILWNILDENSKKNCQQLLLLAFSNETVDYVKNKIADAIAEIIRITLLSKKEWPEILPFLFKYIQDGNTDEQIAIINIFSIIPDLILDHVDMNQVFQILWSKVSPSSDVTLMTKAIDAIITLFTESPKSPSKTTISQLMVPLWQAIKSIPLNDDHFDQYNCCFESLIKLADDSPKLFRPIVSDILNVCNPIIINDDIPENIRHSIVELLVTLCERVPAMMRKQSSLSNFIEHIFLLLTRVPEEDDWETTFDTNDLDDNDQDNAIAEQALDRIACGLEGKVILPICMSIIQSFLNNANDWRYRHAGLMAIAYIAEGCKEELLSHLGSLLQLILAKAFDNHPRVRHATCHAIGQLSTDFAPNIQREFHQPILSHLIPLTADQPSPRVQAHAIAAIINFCTECDSELLTPYLNSILPNLFKSLSSSRLDVQEKTVGAIATVAEVCHKAFSPFYSTIMPILIHVAKTVSGTESRMLRARSIEAITIIATAVGKETFVAHAHEVINLLSGIQNSNLSEDDPVHEFLGSAWVRVCLTIGTDFAPLLPQVIPPLLKQVSIDPTVHIIDREEMDSEQYSQGWHFYDMHGKKIAIHTASLDEKADAIENIGYYANALGGSFDTYAVQLIPLLLPILKFDYFERAQIEAAKCIPSLLTCLKNSPQSQTNGYLDVWWYAHISVQLLGCFNRDTGLDVIHSIIDSMATCLDIVGTAGMNDSLIAKLFNDLTQQIINISQQIKSKPVDAEDLDDDYENDNQSNEYDDDEDFIEYIVNDIVKCTHAVLRHQGSKFLPYFEENLIPFFHHLLTNESLNSSYRHDAICFFDDLVEWTGPTSFKYSQYFLPTFIHNLNDPDPDIQQAVSYGIGICAKFGGEPYCQFCSDALPNLCSFISRQMSLDRKKYSLAIENALSAICKIAQAYGDKIRMNSIIPLFLSTLPINEDTSEFDSVYGYLCSLLESADTITLNHSGTVLICLKALCILKQQQNEHSQLLERLLSCFKSVVIPKMGMENVGRSWNDLSNEERELLSQLNIA